MWHNLKPLENKIRRVVLDMQYTLWVVETMFYTDYEKPLDYSKILCVSLNHLGDLIAITPAIRALKETFQDAEITVWVNEGYEYILENNSNVSNVITRFDGKLYDGLVVFHAGRIWELNKVSSPTKYIPFKVGVTNAGMLSSWFPGLNRRVKYREVQHIVVDNMDVVNLMGANTNELSYDLTHIQYPHGLEKYPTYDKTKPIMILHPGSKNIAKLKYPSHWWPIDNWRSLALYYSQEYNIVFTGTESEKFIYNLIRDGTHDFINTMGDGNIKELINLISHSNIVVSMDSGPVHVASALDIPVVSLMSSQDPAIWRPWTPFGTYINKANHYCKKLECKECHTKYMPAITVREVITKVEEIK